MQPVVGKQWMDTHNFWYDFWDVDLGQPVGEKGQRYENREGLFIREFTNGWAVYNRSGKEHQIEFPEEGIRGCEWCVGETLAPTT